MPDIQQQYMDKHLGSNPECPMCGAADDWFWPPGGPWTMETIDLDDAGVVAPPIGYYILICGSCGHIAHVWESMFPNETLDSDDTT